MPNIVEISDTIYKDIDNPSDNISIPKIASWLRYYGMGKLNNLLDLEISLDGSLNFDPELTHIQSSILIELYFVRYYEKLIESSLGAGSYEVLETQWTELREGDTSIKRISKINLAKEYKDLKNEREQRLNDLVHLYRLNNSIVKEERYQITDDDCC